MLLLLLLLLRFLHYFRCLGTLVVTPYPCPSHRHPLVTACLPAVVCSNRLGHLRSWDL
jgi:hypothetical protein